MSKAEPLGAQRRTGTCTCGKQIERCRCGGTACTGWGHYAPHARHWCGNRPEDGQPQLLEARRDG